MYPEYSRLRLIVRATSLFVVLPLTEEVQVLEESGEELVDLEAESLLSEIAFVSLFIKQLTLTLLVISRLSTLVHGVITSVLILLLSIHHVFTTGVGSESRVLVFNCS